MSTTSYPSLGFAMWCLLATPAVAASPPATRPAAEKLDRLVHDYFTQSSLAERQRIATEIQELDGVTSDLVAGTIRRVALWEPQTAGRRKFTFPSPAGETRRVEVRVPPDYDPAKAYPLIVALHWARGGGEGFLEFVLDLLAESRSGSAGQAKNNGPSPARARIPSRTATGREGILGPAAKNNGTGAASMPGEAGDEFLVAAPRRYRGMGFTVREAASGEPVELLRELRRRYRVDTDRIYVIGYSMGGHAAFALATLYTHWFAGAVPLAGTLVTPYPPQAREILLPNLAPLHMVLTWGEKDVGRGRPGPFGGGWIAGANRNIREFTERLSLPIQCVELSGLGHHGVRPPADALRELLRRRRDPDRREMSHWFRFPSQGRMGWLRQTRFDGAPWRAPQLAIYVPADRDYDAYVIRTLKRKLAYIGGTIEGQRIDITTVNTAEVEIRLHDGLIDLDQPILVYLNGKKRLHATVKRTISTMLELAYEDWEFQHLYPVRLTIAKKGLARQR